MDHNARKYVLLTGATGGIGKEIALRLARRGENLILLCRNEEKGGRLVETLRKEFPDISIKMVVADLASTADMIAAANTLRDIPLSGIIHNAGLMSRNYTLINEKHEATLMVNYFNPIVLTELLLPELQEGACVVFTTSITRKLWKKRIGKISKGNLDRGIDKETIHKIWMPHIKESEFSQLGTYALSKRMITDYAHILASRMEKRNIRVNCADPGVVNSGMITMHRWYDRLADIFFRPFIRSAKSGSIPAIRAFSSDKSGIIFSKYATHRY